MKTYYHYPCAGCAISRGLRPVIGGIVELPGDWIVNQYGGKDDGFLGWLILQPRFHRMELSQLTNDELHFLGPNIRNLDKCLTQYWKTEYPGDKIERVYVVYFFESAFKYPQESNPFHLHIHIIPRFQSLNTDEGLRTTKDDVTWVDGWKIATLAKNHKIPERYTHCSPMWQPRVSKLMECLRLELSARP
jgi:hypothetical protein